MKVFGGGRVELWWATPLACAGANARSCQKAWTSLSFERPAFCLNCIGHWTGAGQFSKRHSACLWIYSSPYPDADQTASRNHTRWSGSTTADLQTAGPIWKQFEWSSARWFSDSYPASQKWIKWDAERWESGASLKRNSDETIWNIEGASNHLSSLLIPYSFACLNWFHYKSCVIVCFIKNTINCSFQSNPWWNTSSSRGCAGPEFLAETASLTSSSKLAFGSRCTGSCSRGSRACGFCFASSIGFAVLSFWEKIYEWVQIWSWLQIRLHSWWSCRCSSWKGLLHQSTSLISLLYTMECIIWN